MNGDVLSVAIWPPECAILLPEVDAVMVPLAQTGPQSQEMSLVMWDEVLPVVKAYQEKKPGIVLYRLDFEDWPREVAAFLAKRRRATGKLNGIGMDEILDRELVEEKD